MTRPALVRLLVLQTVLLVLVGWAAVYFARDEFLLATAPADDDDAASAPLPDDGEGTPVVRLSAAAQRNVGLALAVPARATLPAAAPELAAFVLDAQPLAELHGRLQAARHEAESARAVAQASAAERRRVQGLYDDDRNASQRALEAAQAQAGADAARERAAQAQWAALREGARATWGPAVAAWLEAPDGGALPRLAAGREALLRVAAQQQRDLRVRQLPQDLTEHGFSEESRGPGEQDGLAGQLLLDEDVVRQSEHRTSRLY